MRIGELSRQAGVSTRTVRHYESLGLLPDRRTSNGYRTYDSADVRAVTEIRSLVDLGFALEDTRPFVECLRSGHDVAGSCVDSLAVYRRKIDEASAFIERLETIRDQLERDYSAAQQVRVSPGESADEPLCEFGPFEASTRSDILEKS